MRDTILQTLNRHTPLKQGCFHIDLTYRMLNERWNDIVWILHYENMPIQIITKTRLYNFDPLKPRSYWGL